MKMLLFFGSLDDFILLPPPFFFPLGQQEIPVTEECGWKTECQRNAWKGKKSEAWWQSESDDSVWGQMEGSLSIGFCLWLPYILKDLKVCLC